MLWFLFTTLGCILNQNCVSSSFMNGNICANEDDCDNDDADNDDGDDGHLAA